MQEYKVYIAGKINPNSVFGTKDWRDGVCEELSKKTGLNFINLDPTVDFPELDQNDQKLIYGRDSYLIKSADIVIVYLSDDISVGGSQEMLIAKYYHKPLIGVVQKEGKFYRSSKEIFGKIYNNFLNPFVGIPCDAIATDIDELASLLKTSLESIMAKPKDITVLDDSISYYEENFLDKDPVSKFVKK